MYRTHTCGELRIDNLNQNVTLAGWVQKVRNLGAMTFIDIRDRYGITQLVVEEHSDAAVRETAAKLGREYVIQASGKVIQRASKNAKIPTGEIEVAVDTLRILNASLTPPFTIEDNSDGGDELRMKYRFLDLRRNPLKKALILRHQMAHEVRNFLDSKGFLEIETPYLIKSTPEGARDFVVPSRMNAGEFYALPQSPQTFKQLLMVAGYDRYFQIVRCFRDEDLRADRQPEFTQIDCEMSFVDREDILTTFEGLAKHLFRSILGKTFERDFPRITWHEAMAKYGSDKPDIRFGMTFNDITKLAQGKGFGVFDSAEYIGAICAEGCAGYTRKQLDALTEFVKKSGLRFQDLRSSNDAFFTFTSLAVAKRVSFVDKVLINQRRNLKTSISQTRSQSWDNCLLAADKIYEEWRKSGLYRGSMEQAFCNWFVQFVCWHYYSLDDEAKAKLSEQLPRYIRKYRLFERHSRFYYMQMDYERFRSITQ